MDANSAHPITKVHRPRLWATGYNVVAIPLAAGALYAWGVLLTPALGGNVSMNETKGLF